MPDRIRNFVVRHVAHPLHGMTLGAWISTLKRHGFAVDPGQVPRAMLQLGLGAVNSLGERVERLRFGAKVDAEPVPAPLFILGHYRSGTTHLQNLMSLDPGLGFPTLYQVLNPHTFLGGEPIGSPIFDRVATRKRPQDAVAQGAGVPGEDELALATMTGLSPYMAWCYPREASRYDRYLTFRDVDAAEVARWGEALTLLLKKLTLRHGRPMALKSPPHTARVRLLLDLFPDARFAFIRRDPFSVFRSTRSLVPTIQPLFHIRGGPILNADDRILATYNEMHDAYFADRGLIPEGRLCEVGFEELERDPVGIVGSIYATLGLPGFDALRPRLEGYLGSISSYQKNRHDGLDDDLRRRIEREWARSFDEWGYGR